MGSLPAGVLLSELRVTVSVAICATVELKSTLLLADQILTLDDSLIDVKEVIVATPNRELARRLQGRDHRLIVLSEERREGKASALNRIIGNATGDILVVASADIKVSNNAIPLLVKGLIYHEDWGLADSRVQMGNGDILLMDKISKLVWAIHNATLDDLDEEEKLAHAGDMFAVRRKLVDQIPDITNDDAHLALQVRHKGYRVKRIRKALVWITGPRSPVDYIVQRSRILRGHLELVRGMRTMPTNFEFSMSSRPLRNARLLFKTITRLGPSYIPVLMIALSLEFMSLQIAIIETSFRRSHGPWKIALTTKQE